MDRKIIIIGGTGFIGYHAVKEFIKRGYYVTVICRKNPKENLFTDDRVTIKKLDINSSSDEEILSILNGQDFMLYAAGVDDRVTPKAPAYDFFYKSNVESSRRIFTLARDARIKKAVILGSYFAYFNRIWPEMELSKKHPYIRSRVEQENEVLQVGGSMEVIVLELPYIFGSTPGIIPLWKPLINYIASSLPLFYTKGGTNVISVTNVALAIAGAVENGEGGAIYTIGDENLSWNELLHKILDILGKRKRIITIPNFLAKAIMAILKLKHWLGDKEGGLEPIGFVELQTRNTFFNSSDTAKLLKYNPGDIMSALLDTVKSSRKVSIYKS